VLFLDREKGSIFKLERKFIKTFFSAPFPTLFNQRPLRLIGSGIRNCGMIQILDSVGSGPLPREISHAIPQRKAIVIPSHKMIRQAMNGSLTHVLSILGKHTPSSTNGTYSRIFCKQEQRPGGPAVRWFQEQRGRHWKCRKRVIRFRTTIDADRNKAHPPLPSPDGRHGKWFRRMIAYYRSELATTLASSPALARCGSCSAC